MKKIILISSIGLLFAGTQICGCGSCKASPTNYESTISVEKGESSVKLKITGMTCAGCSNNVSKALMGVDGVLTVDLEYPGDVATIKSDDSKTNKEEIIAAIEKINYKAEEVAVNSK